jgi:hypothetical protein
MRQAAQPHVVHASVARSMSQILWPGAGWENPPLGDLADKASTQRYYRKVPALAALQHG